MFINVSFFVVYHRHHSQKQRDHEIRYSTKNLNFKYGNIVPLYNLPSNVKESIVNNNMNKIFDTEVFAFDDEYEDNNVPNYDIFNKHVFDIFQQVDTIEFAYTIVVLKWNVLGHQYLSIDEYFFGERNGLKMIILKRQLMILMKIVFSTVTKKKKKS